MMDNPPILFDCLTINGEMSELAEGARLEIVCAAKSGTEGSNPSLSAIKKKCLKFKMPKMPKV